MLKNTGKLFSFVLTEELHDKHITKEDLLKIDREHLYELVDKFCDNLNANDIISDITTDEVIERDEPELKVTEFMIFKILDKGTEDELRLVSQYMEAKTKLEELESLLKDNIVHYGNEAKQFYGNISNLAEVLEKYIKKEVDEDDD